MIIPGVFAPDFYLAVKFGEKSKKYEQVIISLFFNRIIGLVLFLVVALVGFLFLREPILSSFSVKFDYSSGRVIPISVFLIILILSVFFLFRKKLIDYYEKVTLHLNEIKSSKNVFFQVFFLKLSFLLIGVTGRIVIAKLIDIEMSLWNLACVIFIVNLLISLPVSLNGIGVREAGYVGLLTMMGIAGNKALSFALFEFGIVLSVFLIGSSFWIYEKLVIKSVYGTDLGK